MSDEEISNEEDKNNGKMSEEKEQIIREEDEHGSIISYPVWSKKNAPKESQNKWEVPIYL